MFPAVTERGVTLLQRIKVQQEKIALRRVLEKNNSSTTVWNFDWVSYLIKLFGVKVEKD